VKDPGARIHNAPSAIAEVQAELPPGDTVEIDRWVPGTQVYPTLITWGHLADDRGYVYGSTIRPRIADSPPNPPPDSLGWTDNWVDVNLTLNVITAYEGQVVRGFFPTSPGRPGWETTRGKHIVRSQVLVQDMAGPGYYVHGVQWISYFLSDGEAIHARTWDLDAISLGVPSSHGCLGVALDAAAFLYRFAGPGTRVYVHD
jgi:L,D-transpeptidase-like protein